jgi:hypothetical protein
MNRPSDPYGSPWSPPGPHDPARPTSDLCRLMPPRRRSELREALDAAAGHGQDDRDDTAAADPAATDQPVGKKHVLSRRAVFFEGVLSNALGGILATLIVTLAVFLWAHFHASHPPAHHPPARPAATATPSGTR